MRVLVINTVPTEKNGITNVIFNLHRAMDKENLQMDLLTINPADAAYASAIKDAGGNVYEMQRSIAHPIRYIRALKKRIQQNQYDIVHAHGNSATLALEMIAAKLGGCRVRIAHSHNTTCKYMAVHKLLMPLFTAACNYRLACGTDAGKWLFRKKEFTVINNGIDTERFRFCTSDRQKIRTHLQLPDSCKLIGHVGLFNEAKNQAFLVQILQQLQDKQAYRLLLIGEGGLRSNVQQLAQECGISEQTFFIGTIDNVAAYLSACDILCMPSLYEGLPLTLIEAQANGLPCVVSENITKEADKTGNVSFLPLEAGAQVWAQQLLQMPDDQDRHQCSTAAIDSIKRCGYGIETEAGKLKDYYLKAMGVG